jgi:hypothetical protein
MFITLCVMVLLLRGEATIGWKRTRVLFTTGTINVEKFNDSFATPAGSSLPMKLPPFDTGAYNTDILYPFLYKSIANVRVIGEVQVLLSFLLILACVIQRRNEKHRRLSEVRE